MTSFKPELDMDDVRGCMEIINRAGRAQGWGYCPYRCYPLGPKFESGHSMVAEWKKDLVRQLKIGIKEWPLCGEGGTVDVWWRQGDVTRRQYGTPIAHEIEMWWGCDKCGDLEYITWLTLKKTDLEP